MVKLDISRETGVVLRGIAILCIVLHNFCHLQGVKENEFWFFHSNVSDFWDSFSTGLPTALWNTVSFLGHYGVEVFVFLSGYGLARKYASSLPRFGGFMRHTLSKLYMLMIPGLMAYAVADFLVWRDISDIAIRSVCTLTFFPNLSSSVWDYIAYGPYWYFGLTLELYIFFYFLLHGRGNGWLLFWSAVVLGIQAVAIAIVGAGDMVIHNMRVNLLIGVPTFCLGVWLGRATVELRRWQVWAIGVSMFVGAIALSVWPHPLAWLLSSLPWPLAMLGVAVLLPMPVRLLVGKVGVLSPWLFVAHPVSRQIVYHFFEPWNNRWSSLLVYLLLSFGLALLLRRVVALVQARYPRLGVR